MKFAIANIFTKNQAIEYNFEQIKKFYLEAVEKKTEIIIFPRLALTGFCGDLLLDKNFINKSIDYLQKIVELTEDKTTNIIIGGLYFKDNYEKDGIQYESCLNDSIFFISDGYLEDILNRKTIAKDNIFNDYKYFDKALYLDSFQYNNLNFCSLLLDDIYDNNNVFLIKDKEPSFLICLDSSIVANKLKRIELIAKFLKCPVIYLNNSNYYDNNFFNGEIILIDKNKNVIYNYNYQQNELLFFGSNSQNDIFIQDVNNIFMKNNNHKLLNQLSEIEDKKILINRHKIKNIDFINKLTNFEIQNIDFNDYFKFFDYLNNDDQKIIKNSVIYNLYHNYIYFEE